MSKELNFSQTHLCQFPISITSITIPCRSRQKPQWFLISFSHFQSNPRQALFLHFQGYLKIQFFISISGIVISAISHRIPGSFYLLTATKKVSNFLPLALNFPQLVEGPWADVQWDCPACSFLRSSGFLHNILYSFILLTCFRWFCLSPPLSFMKVGAMLLSPKRIQTWFITGTQSLIIRHLGSRRRQNK